MNIIKKLIVNESGFFQGNTPKLTSHPQAKNHNNISTSQGMPGLLSRAFLAFKSAHRSKKLTEFEETINDKTYFKFPPDKYQAQAARSIFLGNNLIVSAPTGTGKTMIAEYAIRHTLNDPENPQIYYTSPLKALCNNQYKNFKELFGKENVGINTGDKKINKDARVVVMTTEVYRNIVSGLSKNVTGKLKTVIFDEAHYINDKHRGGVWEESIIKTPSNTNMLFLSATIGNTDEVSKWIAEIQKLKDVDIVSVPPEDRYVPLRYFLISENSAVPKQERLKGINHIMMDKLTAQDVDLVNLFAQAKSGKLSEVQKTELTKFSEILEKKQPEFQKQADELIVKRKVAEYILGTIKAMPKTRNINNYSRGDIHWTLVKKKQFIDVLEKNSSEIFNSHKSLKDLIKTNKINNLNTINPLEFKDPILEKIMEINRLSKELPKGQFKQLKDSFVKALNSQNQNGLTSMLEEEKSIVNKSLELFDILVPDNNKSFEISDKKQTENSVRLSLISKRSKYDKKINILKSLTNVSDKQLSISIEFTARKKVIDYIQKALNSSAKLKKTIEPGEIIAEFSRKQQQLNALEGSINKLFKKPVKLRTSFTDNSLNKFNQIENLEKESPIVDRIKANAKLMSILEYELKKEGFKKAFTEALNSQNAGKLKSLIVKENKKTNKAYGLTSRLFAKGFDWKQPTENLLEKEAVRINEETSKLGKLEKDTIEYQESKLELNKLHDQKKTLNFIRKNFDTSQNIDSLLTKLNKRNNLLTHTEKSISVLFKYSDNLKQTLGKTTFKEFGKIKNFQQESHVFDEMRLAAQKIKKLKMDFGDKNLEKPFVNALNSGNPAGLKSIINREKELLNNSSKALKDLPKNSTNQKVNDLLGLEKAEINKRMKDLSVLLSLAGLMNPNITDENELKKQNGFRFVDILKMEKALSSHLNFDAEDAKRLPMILSSKERKNLLIKDPIPKMSRLPAHKVIEMLHKKQEQTGEDFFPMIYFIFSKAECNRNLRYFTNPETRLSLVDNNEEKIIKKRIDKFLDENPYFAKQVERNKSKGRESNLELYLKAMEKGVGTHHRGMLAPLKQFTEELFGEKLIKVVISTETIAAGLDFPAKTVAINSLEQPYDNFSIISANKFHQMSGRAGRRGKDKIGNVIVINNINNTKGLTFDLIKSPADKLESNLRINYGMTLNYLNHKSPEEAKKMLLKSFKAYQMQEKTETNIKRKHRSPIINDIEDSRILLTHVWNLSKGRNPKKYNEKRENKIQSGLKEIKRNDFCASQITELPVKMKTHLNLQRLVLLNLMGGLMDYKCMHYPKIDKEEFGIIKAKDLENNKNKLIKDIKKAQILLKKATETRALSKDEKKIMKRILFNKNLSYLINQDLKKDPIKEPISDEMYQEYRKKNANGKKFTQDEKNIIRELLSNKNLNYLINNALTNNFIKEPISDELYQEYREKHIRKARENTKLDYKNTILEYLQKRKTNIRKLIANPLTTSVRHPLYLKYQREILERTKIKLKIKPDEKDDFKKQIEDRANESKIKILANNFDKHFNVLNNLYKMRYLARHAHNKKVLKVSDAPFFKQEQDRIELTDKGRVAASIQGVNQIIATELAYGEKALFKTLTPEEIAAVASCLVANFRTEDSEMQSFLPDFAEPPAKLSDAIKKVKNRVKRIETVQKKFNLKSNDAQIPFDSTFSNAIYSLATGNTFDFVYNAGIQDKPWNFMEGDFAEHILRTKDFVEQLRNSLSNDDLELKVKLHSAASLLDKQPISDVLHPEEVVKSDRFEFYPKLESSNHRKPYDNSIKPQNINDMLDYEGVSKDRKIRMAYLSAIKTSPASVKDFTIAVKAVFSKGFKDSIKQNVENAETILSLFKEQKNSAGKIALKTGINKNSVLNVINNFEIESNGKKTSDIYDQMLNDGGLVFEEIAAAEFKDDLFDTGKKFLEKKTGREIDKDYMKNNFRLLKRVNLYTQGFNKTLGEADMMIYDKRLGKVLVIGECKAGDLTKAVNDGFKARIKNINDLKELGVDSTKTVAFDESEMKNIYLPKKAFTLNPKIRVITTKGFNTVELEQKYDKNVLFSKFDRIDVQLFAKSLLFQLKQEHKDEPENKPLERVLLKFVAPDPRRRFDFTSTPLLRAKP